MTEQTLPNEPQAKGNYFELIDEVDQLVSMPTICTKLLSILNNPHSTTSEVETVLAQDPPLTAQLLRWANSPFYGLRSQVDSLSRAVTIIGNQRIYNLVLAVSAVKSFGKLTNGIISIENFWLHSIYTGLIAKILAQHSAMTQHDSVFVAGLLHDIGQLVLFNKRPDDVRIALTLMQDSSNESDIYLYEREVLGYDHMQVGAELARRWHLPESLITCIEYHHTPSLAPDHQIDVALIYLANHLANLAELNSFDLSDTAPISAKMWEITGLSPDIVENVILEAQEQYDSTQAILMAA